MPSLFHRLGRDLVQAIMLLTRLPVGALCRFSPAAGDPAAVVWAYPVVGLLVGGIGALVDFFARWMGMAPPLAAIWTLAAMVAATGALHEDGLADTADGLGGGDPPRRLAIMRDSRIGTYGTLALLLSLAARATSIAALPAPTSALLAAGATGRAAIIVLLLVLRPARQDGLASALRGVGWREAACGLAITVVADCLLLPARLTLLVIAVTAAITIGFARIAHARLGGYTGDVLGAGEQLAEIVTLSLVATNA